MAICSTCGADVPNDQRFCTNCAALMPEPIVCLLPPIATGSATDPIPMGYAAAPAAYAAAQPGTRRPQSRRRAPGTLSFVGYLLLFAVPGIGFLMAVIWSLSQTGNVNRRNLARAALILMAAMVLVCASVCAAAAWPLYRDGVPITLEAFAGNLFFRDILPVQSNTKPQDPNWPDNEFTRQLPKPDFEIASVTTREIDFSAVCAGVTVEQLREYAQKLQKAGFTEDIVVNDENLMDMDFYTFTAKNSRGYQAEINHAMGTSTFAVSKAK